MVIIGESFAHFSSGSATFVDTFIHIICIWWN